MRDEPSSLDGEPDDLVDDVTDSADEAPETFRGRQVVVVELPE